ncbi:MAG TPA: hypothetical protein VJ124_11090 [Pyrinomonadaceae bacterium]|nr:hypothetical protein [Pyrinomonadaceae bacterium]
MPWSASWPRVKALPCTSAVARLELERNKHEGRSQYALLVRQWKKVQALLRRKIQDQKRVCENSALGGRSHPGRGLGADARVIARWFGRNPRRASARKSLVRGAWALA